VVLKWVDGKPIVLDSEYPMVRVGAELRASYLNDRNLSPRISYTVEPVGRAPAEEPTP
jgi:hypothetical protein